MVILYVNIIINQSNFNIRIHEDYKQALNLLSCKFLAIMYENINYTCKQSTCLNALSTNVWLGITKCKLECHKIKYCKQNKNLLRDI